MIFCIEAASIRFLVTRAGAGPSRADDSGLLPLLMTFLPAGRGPSPTTPRQDRRRRSNSSHGVRNDAGKAGCVDSWCARESVGCGVTSSSALAASQTLPRCHPPCSRSTIGFETARFQFAGRRMREGAFIMNEQYTILLSYRHQHCDARRTVKK